MIVLAALSALLLLCQAYVVYSLLEENRRLVAAALAPAGAAYAAYTVEDRETTATPTSPAPALSGIDGF